MVDLQPRPPPPNAWGSWVRLLDRHGDTVHALLRRDEGGFTLVGEALVKVVDLRTIDARIDAVVPFSQPDVDAALEELRSQGPRYNHKTVTYRLVDDRAHRPVAASVAASSRGSGFRASKLDADSLRWKVLRLRRLE